MQIVMNPLRGTGLPSDVEMARGVISTDPSPVLAMLAACPAHAETPLLDAPELAAALGVASLRIKDERQRMGLGSFKALGGAYAVACLVQDHLRKALGRDPSAEEMVSGEGRAQSASLHVLCASAGNHGLSVAAGARVFGAKASVYLSESVPEDFAERLRGLGATVVRAGEIYEESMAAAAKAAETDGLLISDSTWPGYVDPALLVMQGYCVLAAESIAAMEPPTHIFLQAGVGGMASALAASFRKAWGDAPKIVVVEPDAAPCILESVRAGRPVTAPGPVSNMGRLDCKDASHVGLDCLAREADAFVTVSDPEAADVVTRIADHGLHSSASGAAGLVGLMTLDDAGRDALDLSGQSRIWAVLSEGQV